MVSTTDAICFESVARVRVLHADTDAMGIVYHGAYLRWMEHARVELLRGRGLSYAEMEREGLGLPVVEARLRYLRPGRHDDVITLGVAVGPVGRARVRFDYRLQVNLDGRPGLKTPVVLVEGETLHACTRVADGRPVRPPPRLVELLASC